MIRLGIAADLPQITIVRTTVLENHLSVEQLAALGITEASIAAQMALGLLGCWVAVENDCVVGFSMANRDTANIFALFVAPGHEGRGHGSALLTQCENWLLSSGHTKSNLGTGAITKALAFYLRRGWQLADGENLQEPDEVHLTKQLA